MMAVVSQPKVSASESGCAISANSAEALAKTGPTGNAAAKIRKPKVSGEWVAKTVESNAANAVSEIANCLCGNR